jgi:hypothetical protein
MITNVYGLDRAKQGPVMPQSIPAGLTQEHVLRTLADLDAGLGHPFGSPTGYELVHEGRRYAPKAVVGLACRYSIGRMLGPGEFSGGEAPGQANFVLRGLGFTVEKMGTSMASEDAEEAAERGRPWSRDEVDLIVADYFDMLKSELAGESYSKAEHRRALQPLLAGRSEGSVEFKHQNISAVLAECGQHYIPGYRPARNYQRAVLPEAVEDYLASHPGLLDELAGARLLNPASPPPFPDVPAIGLFEDRPEHFIVPSTEEKPWLFRKGRRIDFARRDAMNRHLGQLGEEFAIEVERRRLMECHRDDLAASVKWVAVTCGDGIGFDVLSFDEADDSERFIEVKTTGLGKHFPFYVTAVEYRCSEDCPERFRLYRVFDFSRVPRVYVVGGALSQACRLEPVEYRASV